MKKMKKELKNEGTKPKQRLSFIYYSRISFTDPKFNNQVYNPHHHVSH